MIEYTKGNILTSGADALVNTVNCVGVMGRGIALQFKESFPDNFAAYAEACRKGEVQPGRMFLFETGSLTPPRYIINFPTKRHWRGKSRIEDIESGLAALVHVIRERRIGSIAVPPLGSGLGGLDWADVRTRIETAVAGLADVRVLIFEPNDAPRSDASPHVRPAPPMSAGRAVLVELMDRYLKGLLDPTVSLLEVHKLLYFQQEAGEPLKLQFRAGLYGPFAENLRHVLRAVEGHLLAGYDERGDSPDMPLTLVPGAVAEASAFLEHHADTRSRFRRVADLVEGFESQFGLELLSTVHWVLRHEVCADPAAVVAAVHGWNSRKRQFTPRQISIAVDVLTRKGWLDPAEART